MNAPVEFVQADATVYSFKPASVDLLASRFGVMFFADPTKSFSNMHGALRASGRLAFACWREPRENPWMMAPLQAVYKHLKVLEDGLILKSQAHLFASRAASWHAGARELRDTIANRLDTS